MAEDGPHITRQCVTTFECSLGVLAGVLHPVNGRMHYKNGHIIFIIIIIIITCVVTQPKPSFLHLKDESTMQLAHFASVCLQSGKATAR